MPSSRVAATDTGWTVIGLPAGRREATATRALLNGSVRLPSLDVPSGNRIRRSEEHTSELQSLMLISYAVFCLNKKSEYLVTQRLTEQTTSQHAYRTPIT